ncbi:M13 family metallopeptidase [Parabacteroides sp. FAFU027]|uniref:M13 family metallopeptidase n=1 Tax=Parabacteroides sp. FAFU027 TaxID=2922715 RepID=UPI001FB041B2|nr:M13 family metallopeptidase [Parabacteroides sp. FAFU027]
MKLTHSIKMTFSLMSFLCVAMLGNAAQNTDPLVAHIDSTISPGRDFFMFANGKWFKQNPIPASETSNGIFQMIQDTINAQIHDVCVSSARMKNKEQGSARQKIGDLYITGMDSVSLNRNGINPIKADLARIDKIASQKDLLATAAWMRTIGAGTMYGLYVAQDDKISSKHAVFIAQGGLSLPDREYYFATDKQAVKVRQAFVTYARKMFLRMGYDANGAQSAAKEIMKLETALAKVSRKLEDTRDPFRNYNKMSFNKLTATNPALEWQLTFQTVGLPKVDSVIVGQPEFVKALNGYLKSFPLSVWKSYLKLNLIGSYAEYLDDKTFRIAFDYSSALRGTKVPRPRWKRVTNEVDGSLGDLVGQVYVKDYLPKGTKEKLLEIGTEIKKVYAERIKNLDWMSPETKQKALHKLDVMIMKAGYPDKWKDMSKLEINRFSFAENMKRVAQWHFNYMFSKYGKPVDRTEWDMQPQTYNAYYNPSNNEIVVPGCNILVPGFERKMADDAILYSIIGGSTFGHEMTHGFDDQGAKYDANGNLTNWWTPQDSAKFFTRTKMIVAQFNKYVAVDTLHINGEMTQGENIADLGGIAMGYEAFKKTAQYKSNEIISGFNPDQRFFLGYAMAWMVNARPEYISNQVRSDVHSPARFRVNGPLSDMDAFYSTFHIQKGDAMWLPEELRVKIW